MCIYVPMCFIFYHSAFASCLVHTLSSEMNINPKMHLANTSFSITALLLEVVYVAA